MATVSRTDRDPLQRRQGQADVRPRLGVPRRRVGPARRIRAGDPLGGLRHGLSRRRHRHLRQRGLSPRQRAHRPRHLHAQPGQLGQERRESRGLVDGDPILGVVVEHRIEGGVIVVHGNKS
jgi:hypothetical protein